MSQGSALKFVVDIKNEEKIEALTKDINVQEAAIKKLAAQLRDGAINEQQFMAAATPMGAAIAKTTAEMKALQGGAAMTGRGLMQLGYAVDDIQYGFSAIVNNIPQIAMGFGASAGIAGAVAIAAVAVSQLIKHWGELSDIAQSAWSGGSVEQLHKIREAADEAAKAFEKLTKEHNKATEETMRVRHEAIIEGDVGKILEGLTAGIARDPGMAAEIPGMDVFRNIPGAQVHGTKEERDAAMKKNRDRAIMMLEGVEKDDKVALAQARSLVKANPKAFPKEFINKLDPEAGAAEAARKSNQENEALARKQTHAREAENRKKIEHDNEMLTKEGQQNEAFMNRRVLEDQKRDVQEQIKRGEHMLTGEGRRQLQDKLLGGRAPEESKVMSMKAFADKMLTAGMNTVPQKQLDKLVEMHGTLKDIDKKMQGLSLQ